MNPPATIPAPVQPGDVIRGKYRVERLLGHGGMAYVVAAWHLDLEQRVAIKLLRPETAAEPGIVDRFLREARAASRLEDPHVTRVADVDRLESGPPFIVMEYLEGADLARVLAERAPLACHDVARWVREACSAIAEAHRHGVVHRDLKPANLFLAEKRSGGTIVKVLDFGISKVLEGTRLTQGDVGMGSAEYASPEQLQSAADVDGRTDLWSLGVTMYELLTGRGPFTADGIGAVTFAVMTREPAPPRSLRPDVPVGLEAVILRCLEKDPQKRFASAVELAAALAPHAQPPARTLASAAAAPVLAPVPAGVPDIRVLPRPFGPWSSRTVCQGAADRLRPVRVDLASVVPPTRVSPSAPPIAPPGVAAPFAPSPFASAGAAVPATRVSAVAGMPEPSPARPPGMQAMPPVPEGAASPAPIAKPSRLAIVAAVAVGLLGVVVLAFGIGRRAGGGAGAGVRGYAGRFELTEATVRDTKTSLVWQRAPAVGAVDWAAAKAYCARQGGGFRLPDITELEGLLAVYELSPPLDAASFTATPVDVFWSSTQPSTGVAAVMHFSTGRRATSVTSGRNRVRCVK